MSMAKSCNPCWPTAALMHSAVSCWQHAMEDVIRNSAELRRKARIYLSGPSGGSTSANSSIAHSQEAFDEFRTMMGALAQRQIPCLSMAPLSMTNDLFTQGLPSRPFIRHLCRALALWAATGSFPYPRMEAECPAGLREVPLYYEAKDKLSLQASQLRRVLEELWPWAACTAAASDTDRKSGAAASTLACSDACLQSYPLIDVTEYEASEPEDNMQDADITSPEMQRLAPLVLLIRDILEDHCKIYVLLGCRVTAGTSPNTGLFPSLEQCVGAFVQHNSPLSKACLTVGARALAKHCHRDSSTCWWGSCSGAEPVKNLAALAVLARICTGAVWVNLHHLPPDRSVLEVRVKEGYGARWEVMSAASSTSDTCDHPLDALCVKFRGFLEPQMEGGHSTGWRH